MAEYSDRRGVDGTGIPKRGSRLISRDCTKIRDQDIQLCNRIGCSGRLNSARSTRNVSLDKTKVLKPSKEMTANSSKVVVKVNNPLKPLRGIQKNLPSETASSSSRGGASRDVQEADIATSDPSLEPLLQSDESTSVEIGSPTVGTNLRPKRNFQKMPASVDGSNLTRSRGSGGSKSSLQLSRPNNLTARPGSRYLRCTSVPIVSTSDSASSTRKPLLKKRSSEGESSSSSKAKQPTIAESAHTSDTRSGIAIYETRQARRVQTSFMDNVSALVRAHRSDTSTSRRQPLMSQRESSAKDKRMHRLPYSHSATGRPHRAHNFTRPNTAESSHSINLTSPSDVAHSSSLIDQQGFRHYSINGIAEVLLALDQIEHDEEISYEQLIALESNLFLNGLSFHDQHRDMRLDIDGMSYEDLLALEERMGSVSTALSEEALAKSINKSPYKPNSSFSDTTGSKDDTKCSICQEDYDVGDEMGRLHCKHSFHVECIDQWLRQKNWCPICKFPAASLSS